MGASLVAAAATVALGPVSAHAQEAHQVRYTLASAGAYEFDIFYLTSQPPSMEAFNADAYTFAKREKVTVAPDAPWVFETTMADPQWAIMQVSSTTRGGQAAPNAHCDIAVDGQVVIRPMMYVALSYDHRIIDGQQSVKFLVRLKELVEDPARLMLEV